MGRDHLNLVAGCWRVNDSVCCQITVQRSEFAWHPFGCHRTTRANIRYRLAAYRRGGILISFGPESKRFEGINPSNPVRFRAGAAGRVESPCNRGVSFAFIRNALDHLRPSYRGDPREGVSSRWAPDDLGVGAFGGSRRGECPRALLRISPNGTVTF